MENRKPFQIKMRSKTINNNHTDNENKRETGAFIAAPGGKNLYPQKISCMLNFNVAI